MTPRVLFNITHGFQARMLLRTAIASELIDRGVEIVVLSPNADEAYFRREFDRPGFHLEPMPVRRSPVEKAAVEFRQQFLMNPSLGRTLDFKRIQYRTNHPGRYWLTRAGNLALGRYPPVRRAYQAGEQRFFDGSEFDAVLRTYQPQLVVTGTPGFIIADAHLLRASKRAGIPTATVVLSWDNLTSKGYMGAQPDQLLVWNQVMADEARRYHDFGGPIIEVGAAQFDVYPAVRRDFDPEDFRSQHGVPPGRPLVVWGTINEGIYPRQIDLLRSFVERLHDIPGPPFLWVRAHPQSVHGAHAALAEEYRSLAGPDVHVELPPVASEALPWDLPTSDLHHLADLLTAAAVVITPQSTLTLDAACADTPVINLAVDKDFRRCFEYTHYRNVVKHNGALIVEGLDELVGGVARYIVEPNRDKDGREAIVAEQMGAWFGQAGRRTADVLAQLASSHLGVGNNAPRRELPPCESCGDHALSIRETGAGPYVRCRSCWGEVQLHGTPTPSKDQFNENQEIHYGRDAIYFLPIFHVLAHRAARYRLALLQGVLSQGRVLEVGPGTNHFLSLAAQSGFSCEAVEFSSVMARALTDSSSIPVHHGAFEDLDLPSDYYDAYISFHVLEHVVDPVEHLRTALRVVRPGGYALVTTPNTRSLEHRMTGSSSPNYSRAHFRLFSPPSLRIASERAQWKVVGLSNRARSEDWLRVLTALLRRARVQSGASGPQRGGGGGPFLRKVPFQLGTVVLWVAAVGSWPARQVQQRLRLGNELILVARKRPTQPETGAPNPAAGT